MGFGKKRILIVDDEAEIREILRDLLEDLGEVVSAPDGATAVKILEKQGFDLILTDYVMPGLNGMELLRWLNVRKPQIPIIWITGQSTPKLVDQAWEGGVFDYIEKPFDLEGVRKSVMTSLALKKG